MNIGQWLNSAGKYLAERRPGAGRIDAEALLGFVTGRDRSALYRDSHLEIPPGKQTEAWEMVERRAGGEPLAYITGQREFMGLDFLITKAVLIPRPETELLVERAIELIKDIQKTGVADLLVADIGTGSGAIAVSLAFILGLPLVYATDISQESLEVARKNAQKLGVGDRVLFKRGNLLEPLSELPGPGLHIICANLPYVPSGEIPGLMADVRDYEPHQALDGGRDGMEQYRRLVPEAAKLLSPGGYLLMEIGPGQGSSMLGILGSGWEAEILPDLAGRERVVMARKRA